MGDAELICSEAVSPERMQPQVTEATSAFVAQKTIFGLIDQAIPTEPIPIPHPQAEHEPIFTTRVRRTVSDDTGGCGPCSAYGGRRCRPYAKTVTTYRLRGASVTRATTRTRRESAAGRG